MKLYGKFWTFIHSSQISSSFVYKNEKACAGGVKYTKKKKEQKLYIKQKIAKKHTKERNINCRNNFKKVECSRHKFIFKSMYNKIFIILVKKIKAG